MNLRTQEGLREIGNSSFGAQTQKDKELGGGVSLWAAGVCQGHLAPGCCFEYEKQGVLGLQNCPKVTQNF